MTVNDVFVGCHMQGLPFIMPNANEVVNWSISYMGGPDNGVINSVMYKYWLANKLGTWANHLLGVGGLPLGDFDQAMAYVYKYGGACLGCVITQGNMDQANANEPFDVTGDQTILGGHDVFVLPCQPEKGMGVAACWGMRQQFTQAWYEAQAEEVDCTIRLSEDPKGIDGVDYAKLEAYMKLLGGLNSPNF
jgi:hypothetical protein